MDLQEQKKILYKLIGEDTDKALQLLEELLDAKSKLFPVFLVRKGNWKSIKRDFALGTLEKYSDSGLKTMASISNSLIYIVGNLTEKDLCSSKTENEQTDEIKLSQIPTFKNQSLTEVMVRTLKKMENSYQDNISLPYGYVELDRLTKGTQESSLTIYAGTIERNLYDFYLNSVIRISEIFGKSVLIISLRKSLYELSEILISIKAELDYLKIREAYMEDYEWNLLHNGIETLSDLPIEMTEGITTIKEIKASIMLSQRSHGTQLVIIDSLEYIKEPDLSQSKIIERLKHISKELNIPIIITCLVDFSSKMMNDVTPYILPFFRESKMFIDRVLLGFRPETYAICEDREGNSLMGLYYLRILKNNFGPRDLVKLKFDRRTKKIVEIYGDITLNISEEKNEIEIGIDDSIPF